MVDKQDIDPKAPGYDPKASYGAARRLSYMLSANEQFAVAEALRTIADASEATARYIDAMAPHFGQAVEAAGHRRIAFLRRELAQRFAEGHCVVIRQF